MLGAAQIKVGGSCRVSAMPDARDLGIDPVVEFDRIPSALKGRFDIVFDTARATERCGYRSLRRCRSGKRSPRSLNSSATTHPGAAS